jgi:hypothetical protein
VLWVSVSHIALCCDLTHSVIVTRVMYVYCGP